MTEVVAKRDDLEDGVTPEPLARYHCPACRALTMAPLGQAAVSCSSCGTMISDERVFLELYSASVAYRLSAEFREDSRARDYAAVDAEIFSMMLASKWFGGRVI